MKKTWKFWLVFILGSSLLLLSGCCSSKKLTKTITTTTYKIDTLIRIKSDTIPKIVKVFIHDTAYIETDKAKATSFYDTTLRKLVLKLQEKSYTVPLTISKRVVTEQKSKIIEKDYKLHYLLIGICVLLIICLLALKKLTK